MPDLILLVPGVPTLLLLLMLVLGRFEAVVAPDAREADAPAQPPAEPPAVRPAVAGGSGRATAHAADVPAAAGEGAEHPRAA